MKTDNAHAKHGNSHRSLWWLPCLLMLLTSGALQAAARMVPGFAQSYTIHVYPVLEGSLGRFSGLFPFSASEMLCAVLPLLLIADIIICRHRLTFVLKHLILLISILLLLYTANCGVNYYRDPFVPHAVYAEAEFTGDQLADFCDHIATQLVLNTDDDYPNRAGLEEAARSSMLSLSRVYPELSGFYPRPKQLSFLSRLFSMMGVSGIYSPFTIEANINGEMQGMEKPFTSCHELSHLRGYMNEGEANFIGWLACIGSDNESFRRSGWLIAWTYAGSALRRTDPERFSKILKKLPDDAVRELIDNNNFWISHENKASEVQDQINDAYLKSNGQAEGIMTYGHLTTLMLLWYSGGLSADTEI